jgi:hypothetical protein
MVRVAEVAEAMAAVQASAQVAVGVDSMVLAASGACLAVAVVPPEVAQQGHILGVMAALEQVVVAAMSGVLIPMASAEAVVLPQTSQQEGEAVLDLEEPSSCKKRVC